MSQRGKYAATESRSGVTGAGEGVMGNYCLMGTEFVFGVTTKFWK